jgi:hypothetical protein
MSADVESQIVKCGYLPKEIKGKGTYGIVYSVSGDADELFAFKYINQNDIYKIYGVDTLTEIDILSKIHHPNIIQINKILTPVDYQINGIALVLPLADKSLYDCIKDPTMTTSLKIPIIYNIANAISFLHSNNILHLDIKLENVVLQNNHPYLIDFGLALTVDDANIGRCLSNEHITLDYRPPEIIDGSNVYNSSSDIWSFGILMFYFLSGENIYGTDVGKLGIKQFYNLIIQKFSDKTIFKRLLMNISPDYRSKCEDLLSKVLQTDPKKRISAQEICDHPLFDKHRKSINGTIVDPPIIYTYGPDQRELIKLLIRWAGDIYGDYPVEILFLAIDLFNRLGSYYKNEDENKKIHVVATCLWMAGKITEYYFYQLKPYIEKLSVLVQNMSESLLLKCEMEIISHLSGILYISKFYKMSTNAHDLKTNFDNIIMSRDSTLYARVDINKWTIVLAENRKPSANKNITIKNFLLLQ